MNILYIFPFAYSLSVKCLSEFILAGFEIISLQLSINAIYIQSCLRLSFTPNSSLREEELIWLKLIRKLVEPLKMVVIYGTS